MRCELHSERMKAVSSCSTRRGVSLSNRRSDTYDITTPDLVEQQGEFFRCMFAVYLHGLSSGLLNHLSKSSVFEKRVHENLGPQFGEHLNCYGYRIPQAIDRSLSSRAGDLTFTRGSGTPGHHRIDHASRVEEQSGRGTRL